MTETVHAAGLTIATWLSKHLSLMISFVFAAGLAWQMLQGVQTSTDRLADELRQLRDAFYQAETDPTRVNKAMLDDATRRLDMFDDRVLDAVKSNRDDIRSANAAILELQRALLDKAE